MEYDTSVTLECQFEILLSLNLDPFPLPIIII